MLTGTIEAIYRRHRQGLYTLALSIAGRPEAAEDAVHDAVERLCRGGPPSGDPVAYVFAAVRNAAVDTRRRPRAVAGTVSIFDLPDPADDGRAVDESAGDGERDRRVADAVQQLPAEQREAVVLHPVRRAHVRPGGRGGRRPAADDGVEIPAGLGGPARTPGEPAMTDDLDEIEARLAALPLRRPPAGLDGRIAGALNGRRRPWGRWAIAGTVAAAAAVLVIRGARSPTPNPDPGPPRASPVWVERDVSQTVDDGVIVVNNRVPYRQVRQRTVRQIWWADPATGARLWAEVPTERVAVEPAGTF